MRCACAGVRVGPLRVQRAAGRPRVFPGLGAALSRACGELRSAAFFGMGERPAHLSPRPVDRLIYGWWEVAVGLHGSKSGLGKSSKASASGPEQTLDFVGFS